MRMQVFSYFFMPFGAFLMAIAGIRRFSDYGTILGIKCAELGRIDSMFMGGAIMVLFFAGFILGDMRKKETKPEDGITIVELFKCDGCGALVSKCYHYGSFTWCYDCAVNEGMKP